MDRRNTIQKEIVLKAVRTLGSHATADEIFVCVNSEYPSISRGTVYRNLGILSEEGTIKKVEIPSAADHYDHKTHEHCHVFCTSCSRVFDVDMTDMPDLLKNITDPHGFEFTDYSIIFRGICPECQEKEMD